MSDDRRADASRLERNCTRAEAQRIRARTSSRNAEVGSRVHKCHHLDLIADIERGQRDPQLEQPTGATSRVRRR